MYKTIYIFTAISAIENTTIYSSYYNVYYFSPSKSTYAFVYAKGSVNAKKVSTILNHVKFSLQL
jgi:hypothetical protein